MDLNSESTVQGIRDGPEAPVFLARRSVSGPSPNELESRSSPTTRDNLLQVTGQPAPDGA